MNLFRSNQHPAGELFSPKDRFPKRVIQVTGGHIPDAYDGSYYAGVDNGNEAIKKLQTLAVRTPDDPFKTPDDRLAALGPLSDES